jgi:hypothetical protein
LGSDCASTIRHPPFNIQHPLIMPIEERILTLHPEGKKGVNISKSKYEITRECLMGIFAEFPEISHKDLTRLSKERLSGKLEGNAGWYMETVLLDMMAREIINRIGDKPVRLEIINVNGFNC